jgi:hypothetical protein
MHYAEYCNAECHSASSTNDGISKMAFIPTVEVVKKFYNLGPCIR